MPGCYTGKSRKYNYDNGEQIAEGIIASRGAWFQVPSALHQASPGRDGMRKNLRTPEKVGGITGGKRTRRSERPRDGKRRVREPVDAQQRAPEHQQGSGLRSHLTDSRGLWEMGRFSMLGRQLLLECTPTLKWELFFFFLPWLLLLTLVHCGIPHTGHAG